MSCMNCATYRMEAETLLDKLAAAEARADKAESEVENLRERGDNLAEAARGFSRWIVSDPIEGVDVLRIQGALAEYDAARAEEGE